MPIKLLTVGMVLGLLLSSVVAQASPVTYTFTGPVTSVDPSLAGTFNTSQTWSGSFTYESSTPGFLCGGCSEANGFSDYPNALTNFVVKVGPYTAAPPFIGGIFTGVQVVNDFSGSDRFVLAGRLTGTQFNGFSPLAFLSLDDLGQTAFSDTSLANVGDLSNWLSVPGHSGFWYLAFSFDGGEPRISGSLTSINQVTTVPAPTSATLVVLGLSLLATLRRRALWQRLLGRPASECGRLRHRDGGPEGGGRRRKVLMLAILRA